MRCAPGVVKWWRVDRGVHVFFAESDCIDSDDPTIYYDGQHDNSTTWDWSKLPKERYSDVFALMDTRSIVGLTKIQNEYKLSGETICCDTSGIFEQFTNAIEKGWITVE